MSPELYQAYRAYCQKTCEHVQLVSRFAKREDIALQSELAETIRASGNAVNALSQQVAALKQREYRRNSY